jgi:hypothetical protein
MFRQNSSLLLLLLLLLFQCAAVQLLRLAAAQAALPASSCVCPEEHAGPSKSQRKGLVRKNLLCSKCFSYSHFHLFPEKTQFFTPRHSPGFQYTDNGQQQRHIS